jgi:hypothetical protein
MRDEEYQAEIERISQTCSTPDQYKAAVAKLNARRHNEAVTEILRCSRETASALRDVAARLDSGTQTREESEALRAEMAALREALTVTESSDELRSADSRPPGSASLWSVLGANPLLAVVLILALLLCGFAGVRIVSPWLSLDSPSSSPESP